MTKRYFIPSLLALCFFAFLIPHQSRAQQGPNFDLAERFTANKMQKMTGSTFLRTNWIEDEDRFWYEWEDGNGKKWVFVDAARQRIRPLFDRDEMASQLSETFNRGFDSKNLDLKEFDYDTDRRLFTFHEDSIEFKYHIDRDQLVKGDSLKADEDEPWATYSPGNTISML